MGALFDAAFGAAANPWRQLGALAWWLFWIVTVTGIYLYIAYDTRADGAYASVTRIADALPAGGLARSLHRYASDALLLVALLHLAREGLRGRYAHFRRASWLTGVVALWLLFLAGLGGFWLVWDRLGQYSFTAALEWLDALGGGALVRNAIVPEAVNDRLFSLLVFLHIGLPLTLLAAMGVHVRRIAGPVTRPARSLALGTLATLVVLGVVAPVRSDAAADLHAAARALRLDWFYLAPHAVAEATSPAALWAIALGVTLALLTLPWLARARRAPAAQVTPERCNGCGRCFADCPYTAVRMTPRRDPRAPPVAVVDADLCAACGICVGACPTSVPGHGRVPGIDVPHAPLAQVRAALNAALARWRDVAGGEPRIVVFGCADLPAIGDAHTAAIPLACAGQLPPVLVEHALGGGADGVLVTGCREGDCDFRVGNRWTDARIAAAREPYLPATVQRERVRVAWIGDGRERALRAEVAQLRRSLLEECR
ncbi:MAG: hydrogenase iron-sulfur subunit [Burkholderiales bacterium]